MAVRDGGSCSSHPWGNQGRGCTTGSECLPCLGKGREGAVGRDYQRLMPTEAKGTMPTHHPPPATNNGKGNKYTTCPPPTTQTTTGTIHTQGQWVGTGELGPSGWEGHKAGVRRAGAGATQWHNKDHRGVVIEGQAQCEV